MRAQVGLSTARKAWLAAAVAGSGALATAAADNAVTVGEASVVVAAIVAAFAAVWAATNGPSE